MNNNIIENYKFKIIFIVMTILMVIFFIPNAQVINILENTNSETNKIQSDNKIKFGIIKNDIVSSNLNINKTKDIINDKEEEMIDQFAELEFFLNNTPEYVHLKIDNYKERNTERQLEFFEIDGIYFSKKIKYYINGDTDKYIISSDTSFLESTIDIDTSKNCSLNQGVDIFWYVENTKIQRIIQLTNGHIKINLNDKCECKYYQDTNGSAIKQCSFHSSHLK